MFRGVLVYPGANVQPKEQSNVFKKKDDNDDD